MTCYNVFEWIQQISEHSKKYLTTNPADVTTWQGCIHIESPNSQRFPNTFHLIRLSYHFSNNRILWFTYIPFFLSMPEWTHFSLTFSSCSCAGKALLLETVLWQQHYLTFFTWVTFSTKLYRCFLSSLNISSGNTSVFTDRSRVQKLLKG